VKLVRFGNPGAEKPGIIDAAGKVRDLSGIVPDISGETLSDGGLAKIKAIDPKTLPLAPDGARLGAAVGAIGKYIGIGLNYADHIAETGRPAPKEPQIFMKATSAISGPFDDIELPLGAKKGDWEVELGIVIGLKAKNVAEVDAYKFIAGYCTLNDVSERDFQLNREGGPTKGKSCDTFGPVGPWLVTRDEITDPMTLDVKTFVDDKRYQSGNTRDMVFSVPFIVSYLSQFFSLFPGDIIATGTPAGIGNRQNPPVYLQPGQIVRTEVIGLGEQVHRVVRAPA
jgi:2,4-diketo-3-deoxy-L-fuconate hydrolase